MPGDLQAGRARRLVVLVGELREEKSEVDPLGLEGVATREQHLQLPTGQLATPDQLASQRLHLHGVPDRVDLGRERIEVIARQQVAALEPLEEFAEVNRGHETATATGASSGHGPAAPPRVPVVPARPPAATLPRRAFHAA